MLWFVGLGISGTLSIPIEVVKIIQKADFVYLESFTSPIYKQQEEEIKNIVSGSFKIAKRWLVEDGQEILKASKSSTVVLLSYGDPYVATTHIELRTRAKLEKIETNTIHSASVITSMIGEAGLQFYKVGRIVTIMNEKKSIITPYTAIFKNLTQGLHSIILLEYNHDENYLLDPKDAITTILDVEKEQKRDVLSNDTFAIIASRIGFETQKIIQSLLDEYESGIQITQVQTQKADPPDEVIDAFRDVQAARADMERSKNEAEAYQNDVIPRARGEAAKILQEAEAYKKQVVAAAEGEASRFLAIYNEYVKAKRVTQERMYLETMEKVLADIDKVIIDRKAGGVVPYLPLPELSKKKKGSDTQ